MLESVTGQTLYTQFLMDREIDPRPWLLVEGDDECYMLDPHLDRHHFRSVPAHGKKNVLEAMEVFDGHGEHAGALFVVDADFDAGGAPTKTACHISMSRAYDLEAEVLLNHGTVSRSIVIAHGRKEHQAPLSEQEVEALVMQALFLAKLVGAVRRIVHDTQVGIAVKNMPFHDLWAPFTRGCAIQALRRIISGRFGGSPPSAAQIREIITLHDSALASGHDILAALAAGMGYHRGCHPRSRDLRASFHIAVTPQVLEQLSVHASAAAWGNTTLGRSPWRRVDSGGSYSGAAELASREPTQPPPAQFSAAVDSKTPLGG